MDCLALPISSILRRGSRVGYEQLCEEECSLVRVVVGKEKEKREFLVDPFVLEENPFRVLMDMTKIQGKGKRGVAYLDVDAILFEHMLWLMHNDSSSLFLLNLNEVIHFYAHDF